MYLDTFKEIYKDKPLEEKLILFYDNIRNMDRNEQRSYECMINGSKENEEYYRKEAEAMKERVDWLYEIILKEIKELKKKGDLINQINKNYTVPNDKSTPLDLLNNMMLVLGNDFTKKFGDINVPKV